MNRFGQVGIALAALGAVLALMGLFPGVTGVDATAGIGVVQVLLILGGYTLLIFGAIVYLKVTFYLGVKSNLGQQIGSRLAMTGLLFASLAGLADIFGFGSHSRTATGDIFLGGLQAFGIIASFLVSSFGVVVYALAGYREMRIEPPPDPNATQPHPKIDLPLPKKAPAPEPKADANVTQQHLKVVIPPVDANVTQEHAKIEPVVVDTPPPVDANVTQEHAKIEPVVVDTPPPDAHTTHQHPKVELPLSEQENPPNAPHA